MFSLAALDATTRGTLYSAVRVRTGFWIVADRCRQRAITVSTVQSTEPRYGFWCNAL